MATVAVAISMTIVYLWTSVKIPMPLIGLLLGLFVNVTIVDTVVQLQKHKNYFFIITTSLQVIFIVISGLIIWNNYGFSWKWALLAIITVIAMQVYFNFATLKEWEKKNNISFSTLMGGILATVPYFFPGVANERQVSIGLGVVLIILAVIQSRDK